ncbi:MAG: DUF502 domain-containing protein [Salibacteraceae bacterium]
MKSILTYIGRAFIRGLIFLVPTVATIYVVIEIFILIDGIVPYDIPGLGLLTLLGTITVFGVLAGTILAQPLVYWGNRILRTAPLIETIYSSIKDLVSAFVGTQKKFDQPVLVKMYENAQVQKLGFLTRNDLSELGLGKEKVAVYLPHSYAFSGNLFIVPAESVTAIDAKPADVMKFIVSGGVTGINELPHEELLS